uniref:Uncharacterized protein n=1 Tax=Myotis myotis TaxID=51298 RepID=A0A7J7WHX3_MYOMY|nr:hypothetical protein mMyoMyo1_012165 [Myotis myotis]
MSLNSCGGCCLAGCCVQWLLCLHESMSYLPLAAPLTISFLDLQGCCVPCPIPSFAQATQAGERGWEKVGEGGRGRERVGEAGRGWETAERACDKEGPVSLSPETCLLICPVCGKGLWFPPGAGR